MNSLSIHTNWPEALATVLECRYDMRAGSALAFGVAESKHFRIKYNYFADGETHEGEFVSDKPMPQGTLFPLRYNPEATHEHSHDGVEGGMGTRVRRTQIVVGVIGSVVLSLGWLLLMRGCGHT